MDWHQPMLAAGDALSASSTKLPSPKYEGLAVKSAGRDAKVTLVVLPNEVLLHVLGFLDVSDLLATSRTSHQFRSLALAPILHRLRLRHARNVLPPLLTSPSRPTLTDLIHRSIFLTNTTVVSRRLARSLTAIRLSRRLAARPEPEALVARSVLPPECVPFGSVAPGLVAKRRAVEREQVRDGMRRWVGGVWERRWREKAEDRRRWEERSGVGRVWRLRRFWERVGKGEIQAS
ncbi:putative f-box domain-containing protein [Diaporthe ampelina]|uniref:Putative f-box domain-containing protein n=1 Tax=Diaporthe ampelina TaxID=1214573 RepID=A0A0G2FXT6_9PEZI|nr:putative f-box domain-containing protein [Diaporthe ampelina]